MTTYRVFEDKVFIASKEEGASLIGTLPAASYTLKQGKFGLYLARNDLFASLPPKLYGEVMAQVDRIWTTYQDRPGSTGVLLTGLKGAGKTLLTKVLSKKAAAVGIPTIILDTQVDQASLNLFLGAIEQPIIVLLDEFDKNFSKTSTTEVNNPQEQLLSILDGFYSTGKRLFLFTANEENRITDFMISRPSRVFYHFRFKSLSSKFVEDYCNDKLDNKEHTQAVVRFANLNGKFNFDLLQAMVEEMNRYKETVSQVVKVLNVEVEAFRSQPYKLAELTHDSYPVKPFRRGQRVNVDLSRDAIYIELHAVATDKKGNPLEKQPAGFDPYPSFDGKDLKNVSPGASELVFENGSGYRAVLARTYIMVERDIRDEVMGLDLDNLVASARVGAAGDDEEVA